MLTLYKGAVYREALNTSRISKRDKQEFIDEFVHQYVVDCANCKTPNVGKNVSDYAAVEAVQMLYDELSASSDEYDQYAAQLIAVVALQKFNCNKSLLSAINTAVASMRKQDKDRYEQLAHDIKFWQWTDLLQQEHDQLMAQVCEQEGEKAAQQILRRIEATLQRVDGKNCYRMMALNAGTRPNELHTIGYYWSLDPSKTGIYSGGGIDRPALWRFRARVDAKAVDLRDTLRANLNYEYGVDEKEITMKDRAKIWVYDAQRIYGYRGTVRQQKGLEYGSYELGEKVKINRWMEC